MPNYQLTLFNNSPQPFTFIVYQTVDDPQNPYSLAWLSSNSPVSPHSSTSFEWQDNYAMFFGQGSVYPGAQFTPGGETPANLENANQATFTTQPYPKFLSVVPGQPGLFTIRTDATVAPGQFAVGIGMSNAPSIIMPANPNWMAGFPANPTIWIAAVGDEMSAGTILNRAELSNTMQIPSGEYSASYSFDGNQWSLSS